MVADELWMVHRVRKLVISSVCRCLKVELDTSSIVRFMISIEPAIIIFIAP
jgi:hypothetical protein